MNQVIFRRIALSLASVSFGGFMAVVLLCSICMKTPVYCQADGLEPRQSNFSTEGIRISCTPLIVESLASYDGKFYEDNSGREVMGVAAILLRNCSDTTIPYANVIVYTENCRYEFEGTMLPPDSAVLIPEMNGALLQEHKIVKCFGWITVSYTLLPENVFIAESDNVKIINQSQKFLENIWIYHRILLPEENIYVGGKAFISKIPYLAPGESVSFLPENYAPGYSKVVWYGTK